ncbi:hypothetical protein ACFL96_17560 [Thermoproteota archaeon]
MAEKKRIYNPVTHKYYEVKTSTSKEGKAGQIKGLWSSTKQSANKPRASKKNK